MLRLDGAQSGTQYAPRDECSEYLHSRQKVLGAYCPKHQYRLVNCPASCQPLIEFHKLNGIFTVFLQLNAGVSCTVHGA